MSNQRRIPMAYIELTNQLPGITGLLKQFTQTAKPLSELAQVLLRGPSTLTPGERETIASYVSSRNECTFCMNSHGAAARQLLKDNALWVDEVISDVESSGVSSKMKALLNIAGKVQQSGQNVTRDDIQRAHDEGADDQEIHDTVLIAAAFCMYNRYVDGLGTWAPENREDYVEGGKVLATVGYVRER